MKMEIEIANGIRSEYRKIKDEISKEQGAIILKQLWEQDYLGLTYNLWVDGEVILTFED